MSALTVAVVGAADAARELGKKGTVSDLTLYHDVHDDRALTLVEPTQFPERFASLLQALAMADHALVVVTELTRAVGEALAVTEISGLPATIARGPAVGEEELTRALRGSRLATAPVVPFDGPNLRAALEGLAAKPADGPVEVPIDHAFPVKGVGTVALGLVRRGTVHVHDRLRLYPTAKSVEVRSIQVHDIDRQEATAGERVGVALRGVEADEIERGQTLAPEGSELVGTELRGGPLEKCRYYRGDAGTGATVHLGVGLQVVPARIGEWGTERVQVTTDRPVVYRPGLPAFVVDLSTPTGPRLVGRYPLG